MAWYRDYRLKNFIMFKDYENNIQYGIDESKNWYSGEIVNKKTDSEYLASEEEIEKALRKEAKRRGFVEGAKFLGCHGAGKDKELSLDFINFSEKDYFDHSGLYNKNSWIFYKGNWGEVVKSLDEHDLNKSFNSEYGVRSFAFNNYERFTEKQINSERYEVGNGLKLENDTLTWSGDSVVWKGSGQILEYYGLKTYFYYKSEKHGANFYELVKEIQTKVGSEWKTFVIYKQLGSGLEFSREKEEFYNKFKQIYV